MELTLFAPRIGQKTNQLSGHQRAWEETFGGRAMDLATLREQAERCRRLAKQADPFTQKRLLDLASEYDARIKLLEPQPSAASRILRAGDF
jgi:hypothetical protein